MKILSIDVGIKNLAICLFSNNSTITDENQKGNPETQIILWDTVNLTQPVEAICGELDKSSFPCLKPAKFMKHSKCYCLKHAKKQQLQMPVSDLKPSFINKQKIKTLYDLANKYNIKYTNPIKKADLIALFNEYIYNTCLEPIENINASKMDLVTIGRNIQLKLDEILGEHLASIDTVIIENQISPIANRMKTIQGMIAQYFIMTNATTAIDFISASNKLKDCTTEDKSSYSNRKKLSIQYCLELLNKHYHFQSWLKHFETHNKKDDLADSFLQGIWFLDNKVNK